MKAKNGISLIVLVITIVVIIILAAAVILSLGNNNPINNSKVAQLTQTRDNLESAVQIYLSNQFTKCQGDYTSEQILKGVGNTTTTAGYVVATTGTGVLETAIADATNTYRSVNVFKAENPGTKQFVSGTDYIELDKDTASKVLDVTIPAESAQTWYLSPSTGKVGVAFGANADPAYIYEDGNKTAGKIAGNLASFVTK